MILFVVGVATVLFGIAAHIFSRKNSPHRGASIFGLIISGVGAIMLALSIFTVVPTQQIGIPVTFGQTGDPMGNGFHVKAPWTKIALMDATVQIDDNLGDKKTEIRLGNQSVAYVQNNVRWRIKPEAASQLYRDHKKFENIGPALQEQELAAALNDAFKTYDPLMQATNEATSLDKIADDVKRRLEEKLGDRLIIDSVTIPKVDFDNQTQSRIDQLQQEIGNTRIAEQRKKTAAADAEANKVLADSIKNDPNVLVSKCMDMMNEMIAKGQTIPVGFSCWSSAEKPSVIVDTAPR